MVTARILSKEEFEKIANKQEISAFARADVFEFEHGDVTIFYKENSNESLVFELLSIAKCFEQDLMFVKAKEFDLYLRNPRDLITCDDVFYSDNDSDENEFVDLEDWEGFNFEESISDFCLIFKRI